MKIVIATLNLNRAGSRNRYWHYSRHSLRQNWSVLHPHSHLGGDGHGGACAPFFHACVFSCHVCASCDLDRDRAGETSTLTLTGLPRFCHCLPRAPDSRPTGTHRHCLFGCGAGGVCVFGRELGDGRGRDRGAYVSGLGRDVDSRLCGRCPGCRCGFSLLRLRPSRDRQRPRRSRSKMQSIPPWRERHWR